MQLFVRAPAQHLSAQITALEVQPCDTVGSIKQQLMQVRAL